MPTGRPTPITQPPSLPTRATGPEIFCQFLKNKAVLNGISSRGDVNAASVMQLLNLAGMDYQGQVSSGYGHMGVKSTLGMSIDILEVIAPLIPLPGLTVGINVALTGSILKELFVLIQRYPKALYRQNKQYLQEKQPEWKTVKPVCLLGLEGVSGEITLKAGVQAGAKIPFPSLGDELGINVSAVAKADGQLRGKLIRLSGSYTGAFPSPSDNKLPSQDCLNQVVAQMFSRPDKRVLKEDINKWIDGVVIGWLQPDAVKDRKRDWFKNAIGKPVGSFSERLGKRLEPSKNSVVDRLNKLENAIKESQATLTEAEKKIGLDQIDDYRAKLELSYSPIKPDELSLPVNSFFHLFSFAVGAEASAKASAGANAQTPTTIPWANLNVGVVAVGLLAKANVEIQRIAYRYQSSLSNGSSPLFFTQDTWITYRRTLASAEAFAEVELTPLSFETKHEAAAVLVYQSMNYISTALYWIPFGENLVAAVGPSGSDKTYLPEILSGSGLRIGMSVSARQLIRFAKGTAPASAKICERICENLKIKVEQLQQLVGGAGLSSLDDKNLGEFPKYLFLEAAFTFPDKFSVVLKKGKHWAPEPTGVELMLADQSLNSRLQSLRLRIRISDEEKSETLLFKLGFPVIKSGLNVDLSRVRGAGQEGMYDYYVHWFSNPALNDNPVAALDAQETSIPPVVLLHQ